MPVVTITNITRPEELVEVLADLIELNIPDFKFVSRYDEQLLPNYPCVQIQPGDVSRDYHGTHTFLFYLRSYIYVMHDKLTQTKRVRTAEELKMVSQVVELLHSDITLGGKVIDGFVDSEVPTILPPRLPRGDVVVSTRISWVCKNQVRFK